MRWGWASTRERLEAARRGDWRGDWRGDCCCAPLAGHSGGTDIDVSATEPNGRRVDELERRIKELEARDEAAFGHFGVWDWTACIMLGVVLPIIGIWWFAG
jgi:hypothetical protein